MVFGGVIFAIMALVVTWVMADETERGRKDDGYFGGGMVTVFLAVSIFMFSCGFYDQGVKAGIVAMAPPQTDAPAQVEELDEKPENKPLPPAASGPDNRGYGIFARGKYGESLCRFGVASDEWFSADYDGIMRYVGKAKNELEAAELSLYHPETKSWEPLKDKTRPPMTQKPKEPNFPAPPIGFADDVYSWRDPETGEWFNYNSKTEKWESVNKPQDPPKPKNLKKIGKPI